MLKSVARFVLPAQLQPGRVKTASWLSLAALIIVLDQLSKLWITSHFFYGESLPVVKFFNLVLAHNTGAAFSFLSDAGGWQRWLFSAIALIASVWIVRLLRQHAHETLFCLALALVLGGALGNLIDRVAYGYVVDFLDFYWGNYHFPAFNVADSAISAGAALLLLDSFKKK
ncbi:MAG: signal peptidase II [Gallionellales bacterium 35-53-114]|nr:MAG: signal peptidase II [Gallionellales bacterium 35-53-114]OYZ65352.1 MAG: signal peptidase II [Gallionellales bacterium 24-53-125]OZB08259.1 MAG: signal peptidase II [Gallionellales bacterium 39-52-133]HQS58191.1 signal peptidase II [Gallionellaceae bacterium]HQS73746.1 signal peptidase II [Gallionellaceae bacterium]